jgi:hypothetical protein
MEAFREEDVVAIHTNRPDFIREVAASYETNGRNNKGYTRTTNCVKPA